MDKCYVIRTGSFAGEGEYIARGGVSVESQMGAMRVTKAVAKRYAEAWTTTHSPLRVVRLVPR